MHYTLGASALGHAAFLLIAFFVFKAAVEPMQVRELGQSVQFETISIPHALFTPPPPPEPEVLPAVVPEPKEEEKVEAPKKKVRKSVKKRKVRKKTAPEPEVVAAPVVEGKSDAEVSVPAAVAPRGETDEPGLGRSGADKGDPDAFNKVREKVPVVAKVVDTGALSRAYVGRVSKLLRSEMKYPRAAQRAREEGKVTLEVVIDARGRIVAVKVVTSSGSRVLDDAAVANVKALGAVPAPPSELGWTRKRLRLSRKFRLKR